MLIKKILKDDYTVEKLTIETKADSLITATSFFSLFDKGNNIVNNEDYQSLHWTERKENGVKERKCS